MQESVICLIKKGYFCLYFLAIVSDTSTGSVVLYCLIGILCFAVTMNDALRHTTNITKSMEYFMASGSIHSRSGLGLMQVSVLVHEIH